MLGAGLPPTRITASTSARAGLSLVWPLPTGAINLSATALPSMSRADMHYFLEGNQEERKVYFRIFHLSYSMGVDIQKANQYSSSLCSRGVAQPGSAPGLGPGGREFESHRPDHRTESNGMHP